MNKVAVEGCVVGHAAGSTISGGAFTVTSAPNAFCKASGKKIFCGPLTFTFSGGNAPGCTGGSVTGGGTIAPGSTKVRSGVLFAVLEGDTGTLSGAGVSPEGSPVPVSGPVEISSAGQGKVSAS